jgi:hypothetical protein
MGWATFWATFFHKLVWSPCSTYTDPHLKFFDRAPVDVIGLGAAASPKGLLLDHGLLVRFRVNVAILAAPTAAVADLIKPFRPKFNGKKRNWVNF